MRAIFSETFSMLHYRKLLRGLLEFHLSFEREIFDHLPRDFATKLEHRRKAHLLRADLQALEACVAVTSDGIILNFRSLAERMGALYVLEGATLGGKIIRKHLLARFGGRVEPAISFYTGYGKRSGAEWRSFGEMLGGMFDNADSTTQANVVAGANATFSALQRHLERDAARAQIAR